MNPSEVTPQTPPKHPAEGVGTTRMSFADQPNSANYPQVNADYLPNTGGMRNLTRPGRRNSPDAGGNRHSSSFAAALAERCTILRGQVGSGVHGVTTGDDDRDEMGVLVEPPNVAIPSIHGFEQFQYRTAAEGQRSGPGDLDLVVYSLRKWVRLSAKGNPSMLLLAFLPASEITHITDVGRRLIAERHELIHREAADRYRGYLRSQRARLVGAKSQRTNRPELVERFGFDTKFAYHMVRLGLQGVELLTTGAITLPIAEPDRTWLTELRHGGHGLKDALDRAAHYDNELQKLRATADWPERPDPDRLAIWTTGLYFDHWSANGLRDGLPALDADEAADHMQWHTECPTPQHCTGWIECREPHEVDGESAADGPYDTIEGQPWDGCDEYEFHGVMHEWQWGHGWTVDYPGCVVAANLFEVDLPDDIPRPLRPGRWEVDDDWDDTYMHLSVVREVTE